MTKKAPVSERALLARVNRQLKKGNTMLRRCRADSRWYSELGDFYEVDVSRNTITAMHVDLEAWAREIGAMKPWEIIE